MKEQYITLETAKLAREKGLHYEYEYSADCPCYNIKDKDPWHTNYHVMFSKPTEKEYVFAPTQAYLAQWLREKHKLQVYCYSNTKNGKGIYRDYVVHINEQSMNDSRDEEFQTYEEAFEVGLQLALEMI